MYKKTTKNSSKYRPIRQIYGKPDRYLKRKYQLFWQTFLSIWCIYHHLPSIFCSRLPDECTIWKSKVWFSTDFISDDLKRQRISWRSKVSRTEERFCICPVNVPLGNCRQSICSVILSGRLLSNLTKIAISTLSAAVFVILWMVAVPE